MTLTTHMRIVQPTPIRPLFKHCNQLLGAVNPETEVHDDRMWNVPDQGFPALLHLEWGPDGKLPREDDGFEGGAERIPEAAIDVSFDTMYRYRADNGATCNDLHAYLVRELGSHLDDLGLDWYWEHEYSGEWFHRFDQLEKLGDAEKGDLHD